MKKLVLVASIFYFACQSAVASRSNLFFKLTFENKIVDGVNCCDFEIFDVVTSNGGTKKFNHKLHPEFLKEIRYFYVKGISSVRPTLDLMIVHQKDTMFLNNVNPTEDFYGYRVIQFENKTVDVTEQTFKHDEEQTSVIELNKDNVVMVSPKTIILRDSSGTAVTPVCVRYLQTELPNCVWESTAQQVGNTVVFYYEQNMKEPCKDNKEYDEITHQHLFLTGQTEYMFKFYTTHVPKVAKVSFNYKREK